MDSDSESQDSDDGRRFRFEATRKDATAVHLGTRSNDASPRQKPEQKSEEEYKDYREKRDGSSYTKHESKRDRGSSKERDSNAKEHRHSLKYARYSHEPKTSRHEDGTKEHARNSDRLISKHKTRDSKRHGHRDRSEHRKQRSQERSDTRSQERSSADRNRNKSHERYKHRSPERNRERTTYQTEKSKSSAEYAKPRDEEKDGRESYKRISMKENEHRREYVLAKHTEQSEKRADSEPLRTASNKIDKSEAEKSQGYPELDLSEFDVLSETDENFSDRSEIRGRGSPPGRYRKRNSRKRERGEEGSFERDGTNNSDRQRSGDRHKISY